MTARAHSMGDKATLTQLLKESDGVVLGDMHDMPPVQEYVKEIIPTLKKAGVTTLYVEMLPQEAQPLLDALATPLAPEHELHEQLTQRWGNYRPSPVEGYMHIINAAHDNGMRVVAMDTDNFDRSRVVGARNELWEKYIRKQQAENGNPKYAVYCGAMHIHNFNLYSPVENDYDAAEGLDRKLGIKSITFDTSEHLRGTDRYISKSADYDRAGDYKIVLPQHMQAQPGATPAMHLP